MPTTKLIIQDEVNCKFEGLDVVTRRKMVEALEYFLPYARHTPSYKLGRWNGKMSFCDVGARSYLNLLDRLLPIVQSQGYEIEIDDQRENHNFEFEEVLEDSYSHVMWPNGHPLAGQPIVIKEHQLDVINSYLENVTGINIAPTGSGKCLGKETKLSIELDETTPFGKFMINKLFQQGQENDVTGYKRDS